MIVFRNILRELSILTILLVIFCGNIFASYQQVIEKTSGQRKEFLTNLVDKIDSPNNCYDLIKRRFLDGNFEDAQIALDLKNSDGEYISPGYNFALLRAQCAREIFSMYSRKANPRDWPSEEHVVELRRLARNATKAYEEAFRLADSDFEKAYVYARWHEMHTRGRFEADSVLLRNGSPLEKLNEPIDEKLQEQLSILRPVIANSLNDALFDNTSISPETKQTFIDVMVDEYKILGRIGVPDDIFKEIIKDIPDFLDKAINDSILREPEKYHISIQYHLWYALTGPRPDEIDNEYIDKQIEIVDNCLHEKFNESFPYYEEASNTFLELVKIERENRFIPRFNQPALSYQWSEAPNIYNKSIQESIIEDINNIIIRMTDDIDRQLSRSPIMRRGTINRTPERISRSISSLASSLILDLMRYQRLQHYQVPPGVTISGSSGTTHDKSGIWVFAANESIPVPPYPWKKDITPIDASTSDTKRIAARVIEALNKSDLNTLNTMIKESRDFTKQDIEKLVDEISNYSTKIQSVFLQDANDILVEEGWSWSAVRAQLQDNQTTKSLYFIFRYNERVYWLTWAGFIEYTTQPTLAYVFNKIKPGLELPIATEPVEFAQPIYIDTINNIAEMESLESVEAGSEWEVQLATISASDAMKDLTDEGQSSWSMLYCKANWNNSNKPPRTIPFKRFEGQHLGPIVWTINADGFREEPIRKSSLAVPPVSVRGDGCVYAAVLPSEGMKDVYLQVYSAIDGRELARQHITHSESIPQWGRFMTYQKDKYFGVPETFAAARPTIPPFIPIAQIPGKTSLKLKLDDGFFELKTEKRILPTQGSRLLARWWINGEPVTPQVVQDANFSGYTQTEGPAKILRLPATLPLSNLNAKQGDKIDLQVMLCPDYIKSISNFKLNDFSFDNNELPCDLIISNKISFKADSKMLAKHKTQMVTAGQFKSLTDAIEKQNIEKVKRLLSACPELAYFRNNMNMSAIDYLCETRPKPRRILFVELGGHTNAQYWKTMSKIAEILIDYGTEINAKGKIKDIPLETLLGEEEILDKDKAVPDELIRLLLDRGADLSIGKYARNTDGTVLQHAVKIINQYKTDRLMPVVKTLLEYGADVFEISEPWDDEPVYNLIDTLKQKGYNELANMIKKSGEERQKVLEPKVILGVDEFLSSLRYAGEKELAALDEELPIEAGMEWLRLGRSLQRELGPELRTISDINNIRLQDNFAEVIIPTGLQGNKEILTLVLMKYPTGDYHVFHAGLSEKREPGRTLRNSGMQYEDLINSIDFGFGKFDKSQQGGNMTTTSLTRVEAIKLTIEQGRLVVKNMDTSSRAYFRIEITPINVFFWRDIWELYVGNSITFKTDRERNSKPVGYESIYLSNGCITINTPRETIIFSASKDKVLMKKAGQETLSSEFIIDLATIEIKNSNNEQ